MASCRKEEASRESVLGQGLGLEQGPVGEEVDRGWSGWKRWLDGILRAIMEGARQGWAQHLKGLIYLYPVGQGSHRRFVSGAGSWRGQTCVEEARALCEAGIGGETGPWVPLAVGIKRGEGRPLTILFSSV